MENFRKRKLSKKLDLPGFLTPGSTAKINWNNTKCNSLFTSKFDFDEHYHIDAHV